MGKMLCRCGCLFDMTPSPEPDLWITTKQAEHDTFIQASVEADVLSKNYEQHQEHVTKLDLMTPTMYTLLYNCPVCNRIYWLRDENGEREVFAPEPKPPAD